jgi:hypothetical protein
MLFSVSFTAKVRRLRRTGAEAAVHVDFIRCSQNGTMSTTSAELKSPSTVHVERTCNCPFSIATEYAVDYLKAAESGGPQAVVRVPLPLVPVLGRKVSMSFGLAIDVAEEGRKHDEIRLRWQSGSPLFPNFNGTIRFRIDGTKSTIAIDGSYTPPFGTLGTWFDRLAGGWIAARTLDDLAQRVCRELERRESEWRAGHVPAGA